MTEKKRFVASVDESCIVDNLDNKGLYSVVDTVECLNNLHEENEQLNSKILDVLSNLEEKEGWKWEDLLGALDKIAVIVGYETELLGKEYTGSYEEDIEQLQKEYKELSEENEQLQHDATILIHSNQDYRKENEQLKSENNMLKHIIGRNEAYIKKLTETSEWHC